MYLRHAGQLRQLLLANLAPEQFTLLAAAHERIPALLNAGDIGCILLEPSPRNRTTSPVKFAEHVLSGLPVIITSQIGDYSAMTAEHDLGLVVEDDYQDLDRLADRTNDWLARHPGDVHRRRIQDFGRQHLSRARRIPDYLRQYKSL
jgi:glycosyltransferase involved in cell wall biosynthesis